jgi:hypothetical protein
MLFIGGAFVLGIHYAAYATEQTLGAAVAKEAVSVALLHGIYRPDLLSSDRQLPYTQDHSGRVISDDDRLYPSISQLGVQQRQYYWQALCRSDPADPYSVLLTIFVCRTPQDQTDLPDPVLIRLTNFGKGLIPDQPGYVYDGGLLVRDNDGLICRARRLSDQAKDLFVLKVGSHTEQVPGEYWVIRPPKGKGRDPTLAVYQTRLTLAYPTWQAGSGAGGGG